ncbi:MAG: DUF853 family protein [Phycisphaeraceae bacterium]|nr:DUF853 family protein [Phycisphaeraceae bacterium]
MEDTGAPLSRPDQGLYLGRRLEDHFNELVATDQPFVMEETDLLTHVFICGVTGSGKTVLAKALVEEAALKQIPAIAIDLKGDISALALMMSGEDPEDFIPWVAPLRGRSIEEVAADRAEEHKRNLSKWGFTTRDIEQAKKRIGVNIFTPRSNDGFRLALSAFPEPPDNLEEMKVSDPDAYMSLIDFLAGQFVARLSVNRNLGEKAKGYVFEIIKTCFARGMSMHGYDGVQLVLDEIRAPELDITQIGGMPRDEYIKEKDREHIANAVNGLLTGAGRSMYEGWPISIDTLLAPSYAGDRTPISVINLSHLEFKDQAYVVGYVAYLIWFWMRRLEGTYDPRLLFFIDEIGGGGGKSAFFPSVAISSSKPALNLLLRQGRAKGVCCVFATQNPGDIDYKGLSNCGTWMVGQLRTKRDRSKIEQGAAEAEYEFESARRYLPTLNTGQFVVKTPTSSWSIIQERWLWGLHRPLAAKELQQLKSSYESDAKLLASKGEEFIRQRNFTNAISLLREAISKYPFSSQAARSSILLARALVAERRFSDARLELDKVLHRWVTDEELGEAKFLLGSVHEHLSEFELAKSAYGEAERTAKDTQMKEQARVHEGYCSARAAWPTLSLGEKIVWWLTGRKADEGRLLQLQMQDDRILTTIHHSVFANLDFSLPPSIDYQALVAAAATAEATSKALNAEAVKTAHWVETQVPKLAEFLAANDLEAATRLAERIIPRLHAADMCAPEYLLRQLKDLGHARDIREKEIRHRVTQTDARQFEFEIARLLCLMGYEAHATQATNDDGIDVFARRENEKVLIQCKKWETQPVGRAVVDELAGAAARHAATRTIIATTSTFSDDAERVAREHRIELWDFDRLRKMFQEFGQTTDQHSARL